MKLTCPSARTVTPPGSSTDGGGAAGVDAVAAAGVAGDAATKGRASVAGEGLEAEGITPVTERALARSALPRPLLKSSPNLRAAAAGLACGAEGRECTGFGWTGRGALGLGGIRPGMKPPGEIPSISTSGPAALKADV
ncbi:MAG: hypothetical protein AMXMBFR34_02830 [Myxococcaceae bacterium]